MSDSSTNKLLDGAAEHDPIHTAAAEWFVRLQERNLPLEATLEWQRWMNADARHTKAFVRIEEVWEESWEMLPRPEKKYRRGRGPMLAWAASIALLAVAISWFTLPEKTETVQTTIAQNRTVHLSDGSDVVLGANTQLKISLNDNMRRLKLLRGEAFFTVAKDLSRPFIVDAGEATVTALGTQFNVRRSLDRTTVAVVEGRVIVAPTPIPVPIAWINKNSSARAARKLDAGEQAIVDDAGVSPAARLTARATVTGWQTGQLAFREEPLRYVLEDVNRYALKPIVIGDSATGENIGDIRITGTVLGNSVEGWIASLGSAFGLQAREEAGRIVLVRAKSSAPDADE